jgi:hypothetical protein
MTRWNNNVKKLPLSLLQSYNFFVEDLMDALGVVYPQYWLQLKLKKRFNVHLTIIKVTFCYPKKIKLEVVWVQVLFSNVTFDLQNLCLSLA